MASTFGIAMAVVVGVVPDTGKIVVAMLVVVVAGRKFAEENSFPIVASETVGFPLGIGESLVGEATPADAELVVGEASGFVVTMMVAWGIGISDDSVISVAVEAHIAVDATNIFPVAVPVGLAVDVEEFHSSWSRPGS